MPLTKVLRSLTREQLVGILVGMLAAKHPAAGRPDVAQDGLNSIAALQRVLECYERLGGGRLQFRCADLDITIERHGGQPAGVYNTVNTAQAAPQDAAPAQGTEPVLATLSPTPPDLVQAVDAWTEHMTARNKRPRSIAAFRQVVMAAAKDGGWTRCADLTFDAITGWLGAKRQGGWAAGTYNRNLSCFRSLTKFLVASGRLEKDPLGMAERADGADGEGSRAGTVEEARRLIAEAYNAQQRDRRCKGNRALYWLVLFKCGARSEEPAKWKWTHLHLEVDTTAEDPELRHPHIVWTPEVNKNRRRQVCPLDPETAELLRRHRETVPHGPDDPVFPVAPPRTTFRVDRDRAGIKAEDHRGRKFSPHSARKSYATWLTSLGVPAKMCDRLMRHAGTTESRYQDAPFEDLVQAVKKIPLLWPTQVVDPPGLVKNPSDCAQENSCNGVVAGDNQGASRPAPEGSMLTYPETTRATGTFGHGHSHCGSHEPARAFSSSGPAGPLGLGGLILVGAGLSTSGVSCGNADSRAHNGPDTTAVADFLDALARFLRSGGGR